MEVKSKFIVILISNMSNNFSYIRSNLEVKCIYHIFLLFQLFYQFLYFYIHTLKINYLQFIIKENYYPWSIWTTSFQCNLSTFKFSLCQLPPKTECLALAIRHCLYTCVFSLTNLYENLKFVDYSFPTSPNYIS